MGAAAAHVLVFPMPLQGHINVMLHLATALAAAAGVHVTFLHTDHNLRRLGNAAAATTAGSPRRLRFLSVPDGLPDDHPRSASDVPVMVDSLLGAGQAAYRALLGSLLVGSGGAGGFPPVTSVVADALLTFAIDVAEELGVPALAFRTASASSLLAYMSVPRLFELGELPFPPGGDLDEPVRGVPGMEGFLRRRDLPSTFRRHGNDHDVHPKLQMLVDLTTGSCKARAVILNTAASLEAPALAHIAPRVRDVFAVGPLHAMSPAPAAATSLWREDDGCMAWLDGQADRSVVYVSLGSLTVISPEQFTEFLSGLVAAGHPFLWVLRPDMVTARLQHADLQEAVTAAAAGHSKARVVEWAPQRDVLRHRAVGCFLTHAGWNSTLEAAVEGVPTVCWPFFVDQQINSRFVGGVWGTGLDMKDACDAAVVARMVREAMESGEIRATAQALAEKVRRDVADGGSSATEFKRLVGFLQELATRIQHAN
ncbi:myricetin 3-O-rhamnoside 1,2-glucosyltransferase UGT709G2-like [Oryza glaberrima]|uniref:myricetin 3-O-rhamnoside 1,2-glucosyltransferase UGT709G2-like n=1 Tax=Oryza glaberrima TaxID=4538 RepID=UPI00224C2913|nr:myricetin 3-O-rhamnoside 1,2-glucosyltransferase UGT709G2-like [Oryza glaberrima]